MRKPEATNGKMKAIVIEQYGGPEVLKYTNMPIPKPRVGEVLVKVRACALNRADINAREGWYGRSGRSGWRGAIRFPRILGMDIAGDVVAFGGDVQGIDIGQKVAINPWITCGKCAKCKEGNEDLCPDAQEVGSEVDGGYAEYVRVPAENVILLPSDLSYDESAALAVTFGTAWHMIVTRAGLTGGEQVLVTGGGSGVGVAAIQVAKMWGTRVIAIASSEEKIKGAYRVGADHVINYSKGDFVTEVMELTGGRGVDLVVDVLGGPTWSGCLDCLRQGGRLAICGAAAGHTIPCDLRTIYLRHLSVIGSSVWTKSELREVFGHFLAGRLRPVLGPVFRLEEAAAAQAALLDRHVFGKVVLRVA